MPVVKSSQININGSSPRRGTWFRVAMAIFVLILIGLLYIFKIAEYRPEKEGLEHRADFFGITFSTKFCDELGLGWKETYRAILDELQVKYIRIPVYWDEIEREEGVYDFSDYDYLLDTGEKNDVKFILSIGRRIPRWPECHSPAWLNRQSETEAQAATLKMIATVIERYRDRASIEYWQIENEPFLGTFGVCPPLDEEFLQQEFALARSLDDRQLIITGSGELSSWKKEAAVGDIFGSTLYRSIHNKVVGHIRYPFSTWFYETKAKMAGLTPERLMVLELQAEPWVPQGKMIYLSDSEINRTMSIQQFKNNIQYAVDLDFRRAYFWGTEWWYWQKKYGNPEYWRIAASLFAD